MWYINRKGFQVCVPVKMRYLVILISIFLVILAVQVYPGGRQEDQLDTAEKLIEEKRYNEAIKLITDVIKTNPKLLDHGERLLKKIRDARSNYNQVFNELTVLLQQDDIDEEAAYTLLQELKELDKNPNEASMKAVAEATAGIVFKVNDRQFRKIMDEADVI